MHAASEQIVLSAEEALFVCMSNDLAFDFELSFDSFASSLSSDLSSSNSSSSALSSLPPLPLPVFVPASLAVARLWSHFCDLDPSFPAHFAAYRHCRALGWIPKTGLKFGAHFCLYASPAHLSHAAYLMHVLIEPLEPGRTGGGDARDAHVAKTWMGLGQLLRVANSVSKVSVRLWRCSKKKLLVGVGDCVRR